MFITGEPILYKTFNTTSIGIGTQVSDGFLTNNSISVIKYVYNLKWVTGKQWQVTLRYLSDFHIQNNNILINNPPTFNLPSEITASYCIKHKTEDMIDIKHKRCIQEGCIIRPSFNLPTETKVLYCNEHKLENMINIVNKKLATGIKDAQTFAFGPPAIPGLGNGSGFSIMLQDKAGNTPEYLAENTMNFLKLVNERPEIARATTTFQATVPQRYMDIDKEKALKLGVRLSDLYTTVGAFMGGAYVNDFTRFGRLYKTYIQAEPEYRVDESKINDFFIMNIMGLQSVYSSPL